ncbi:MAG: 3-dehydroquinate synthase [Alphaproteobacteria bacterium]
MKQLKVDLKERSYDILIGHNLILNLSQYIEPHICGSKAIIVTDNHVSQYWLSFVEDALKILGKNYHIIEVAAGEASKSFANFEQCCNDALYWGIDRQTTLIALGGGVVGDLTGFLAASLLRGLPFIQLPTSLLAQVDSSVGGKTGINAGPGKNLVGAFWQPQLVLADVSFLGSLSERQLRSGYGEVIKYGLIHKPEFFEWLSSNNSDILAKNKDALSHIIYESCASKAQIVGMDEHEQGQRALLNLGHSFGHVLEAFTGYSDKLLHGEAIAIGMQLAFDYSVKLGVCPQEDAQKVKHLLEQAGLPISLKELSLGQSWSAEQYLELIKKDKKVKDDKITLILAKSIGKAYIEESVSVEELYIFLEENLS